MIIFFVDKLHHLYHNIYIKGGVLVSLLLESNYSFIQEELSNCIERKAMIGEYLKNNKIVSIYKRNIKGKFYYYKKFRYNKKSVSEYLCNSEPEYKKHQKKNLKLRAAIKKAKQQEKEINIEIYVLKKQLNILEKFV